MDLDYLRKLRHLSELSDEEMVNEFRTHFLNAHAATPSIETLVHAFIPHKFVDHTHPDAILALSNQLDGEKLLKEALGEYGCLAALFPSRIQTGKSCRRQIGAESVRASPRVDAARTGNMGRNREPIVRENNRTDKQSRNVFAAACTHSADAEILHICFGGGETAHRDSARRPGFARKTDRRSGSSMDKDQFCSL